MPVRALPESKKRVDWVTPHLLTAGVDLDAPQKQLMVSLRVGDIEMLIRWVLGGSTRGRGHLRTVSFAVKGCSSGVALSSQMFFSCRRGIL